MRHIIVATTTLALVAVAGTAQAQSRWGLELRGGAAFATQDFGDADLGTGVGLEATLRYRVLPHVALYGGWDWYHFTADGAVVGEDMDIEDTGYAFGLRFEHPMSAAVNGWVRAGGLYDHAELENGGGDITADSGHGLGWEVGAGFAFPVGDAWSITPGARYRSLSRDIEIGGATTATELSYVTFELGFAWNF